LFRSDKTCYENLFTFDAGTTNRFFTWRQTANDPPNVYCRTLKTPKDAPTGEATFISECNRLTNLPDPSPSVRRIKQRLVTYTRSDGVGLSFVLHTPPGYQEGARVPTILYAYPLDYASTSTAGQTSGSDAMFTTLREYEFLLLAGYAILNHASFPIIGDPKSAYDTYLDQLVANAEAAIRKAVELGVADPDRIGVTGHSHGALMTANLLAHSKYFRAGVATSGAYNKVLTPFGFQSERRSIWEAPTVYQEVSPFFVADKIKTPLLIMHGLDDANPGTRPLQASLFYEAIRGNGGTAKLVLLPNEPHWYAGDKSNEHVISEMVAWFDRFVKNGHPNANRRPK
jgi:dipeptidyl aminopeptidase/acylaminoacyl peptidase